MAKGGERYQKEKARIKAATDARRQAAQMGWISEMAEIVGYGKAMEAWLGARKIDDRSERI